MMRTCAGLSLALFVLTGCESPQSRLNAPPHGEQAESPDLQGTYVYMSDNALLESMSIADYHFLPNRSILNTMGKQRLNRLASLIEEYGGEVRYNSNLDDDELINQRTQAIIAYMGEIGVDTKKSTVTREPASEVTNKSSEEAILIKVSEGTYRPRRNSGGGGGSGGGAPPGVGIGGN